MTLPYNKSMPALACALYVHLTLKYCQRRFSSAAYIYAASRKKPHDFKGQDKELYDNFTLVSRVIGQVVFLPWNIYMS
jgi:hypothetical protein